MSLATSLAELVDRSAQRFPQRVAVEDPASGGAITYEKLATLSDAVRDRLIAMGVRRHDRVGIYLTKSIDAVAAIFGVLKAGAAYVPVDPHNPCPRNAYVFANCAVRVAIVEATFAAALENELAGRDHRPPLLVVDGAGTGAPLEAALAAQQAISPAPGAVTVTSSPDDLAYLLYTSGSTGNPKGVILTQENALSFIHWCSEVLEPNEQDRFSSHAPFHFDLSILDIYVPLKHGATLVLVSHETGKEPVRLAALIAERRLTVWYSVPSILTMLTQYGNLPGLDLSALRTVLFAGEVFPVKHLRELQQLVPEPRYYNLYGPTETNVCTWFEIPRSIPPERTEAYPIGKVCSHLRARVVDAEGREVPFGAEGELCIRGPGVTQGYWNLEEQTRNAYFRGDDGVSWYRTGDLVTEDARDGYLYRGRRDRMVKKRGYRVELGEIESCLHQHPQVNQAAVIALMDEEAGIRVRAFLSTNDGQNISLIALKRFCSERIPVYMVPDSFTFLPSLPTTSTDKINYQALKEIR